MRVPPPVRKPRPKKLAVVGCSLTCSLNVENIGEDLAGELLALSEAGHGRPKVLALALERGAKVSSGAVQRHLANHLRPEEATESVEDAAGGSIPTVELLDSIITSGYRNRRNWKPTIQDVMKAMEMKLRVTGASAFEDFFDAIDSAVLGDADHEDEEEGPENLEALLSEGEREPEEEDDEPLARPVGDFDYVLPEEA